MDAKHTIHSIPQNNDSSDNIIVRDIEFKLDESIGPYWHPDKPEWSHISDAIFISLPYIEPYLISNMHQCISQLDKKLEQCQQAMASHVERIKLLKNGKKDSQDLLGSLRAFEREIEFLKVLKKDMAAFIKQESNHFKQHRKYNEALKNVGYTKVKDFERRWAKDLRSFYKRKSLKFNLAYAVGFETITYTLASMLVNNQDYWLKGANPNVSALVLWHSMEEIEHKTVAFDVYQTLCGGYFYRVYGFLFVLWHFLSISWPLWKYMLEKNGLWSSFSSRCRLFAVLGRMSAALFWGFLEFSAPKFHPNASKDPILVKKWKKFFSRKNGRFFKVKSSDLSLT